MDYEGIWTGAIALAAGSLLAAYFVPHTAKWKPFHVVLIVLWAVGPPAWFLGDAANRIHRGAPTNVEERFYESAEKFWAGMLVALFAIYTKDKWGRKDNKDSP